MKEPDQHEHIGCTVLEGLHNQADSGMTVMVGQMAAAQKLVALVDPIVAAVARMVEVELACYNPTATEDMARIRGQWE
jgi:hypothetical protein